MGQQPEHSQGDKINPLHWLILMIEEWCVLKRIFRSWWSTDGWTIATLSSTWGQRSVSFETIKHQNFDYMLSWQTLDSMQLLWTYQVCPNEHNHCQHPWTIHLQHCLLFEILFLLALVILEYSFISILPFWLPTDCCHLYKEWDEVTPSPQDSTAMI